MSVKFNISDIEKYLKELGENSYQNFDYGTDGNTVNMEQRIVDQTPMIPKGRNVIIIGAGGAINGPVASD